MDVGGVEVISDWLSLSHTHLLTSAVLTLTPLPPSPLLLTHTFSLSHQCVTVHVKTFSSIVLPLSLFRASSWTPQQVFSSVKQQLFSLIGLSLPVPEWNQLHWAHFSWGGKKKVILSIIIMFFLNIYFFIHCHGYNMSEREQPWL